MHVISFLVTVFYRFFLPAISFFCLCNCSLYVKGALSSLDGGENNPETVDFDAETHQIDGLDADVEMPPPGCGNGVIGGSEECDDGNDIDGDGCDNDCAYSCHDSGECDDGELCNGDEWCDTTGTHMCRPGTNIDAGVPCNDSRFCTLTDECDGSGNCVGTRDTCDDGISCTTDSCDEGSDSCTNTIDPGYCLIDENCHADGAENPSNECRECRSSASSTSWTQKADMTDCTGGKCCEGICRTGAECCENPDCPPPECLGTDDPCDTFSDQSTCDSQEGCTWYIGEECNSGTYDCGDFSESMFICTHCGCTWGDSCEGGEKSCSTLTARDDCENCNCTWTSIRECRGTHPACSTYTTKSICDRQTGCDWKTYLCQDYTCQ